MNEQDNQENIKLEEVAEEQDDAEHTGMPDLDENMPGKAREMMAKPEKVDELEKENAELKSRLGRLAADFEGYRSRTATESMEAEAKGISKAAEAIMPVYDDLDRALSMGVDEPAKLIPGMQAVQSKILGIFNKLGLEATGSVGEKFDMRWHEAIQAMPGEDDDTILTVYQTGFKLGDRLVRPARVVVSRKD